MPTATVNYDVGSISNFSAGSDQIEILSGSVKTGSHTIMVAGDYQNLCTVVTQSGMPINASIMASGDYFNLYWDSSISNISGSWNVDNQTSGSTADATIMKD